MTKRKKTAKTSGARASSMTGFGRGRETRGALEVLAEIRTVNSRFFDPVLRVPREYYEFEAEIRELLVSQLTRGRVELTLSRSFGADDQLGLRFRKNLFSAYLKTYQTVGKEHGVWNGDAKEDAVYEILERPELFEVQELGLSRGSEKPLVRKAVQAALKAVSAMRQKEGAKLCAELRGRLNRLQKLQQEILKLSAGRAKAFQARLISRVKGLAPEVQLDLARLSGEVALLADRIDITEELVRLKSHFSQFSSALNLPSQGKKLDFLIQEMGREFNTITSKAQDAKIQSAVVEAKTELEKMKEQVQNLE